MQGGSAAASLGANACSSLESLEIGASCTYVVNVSDNETDLSQQINVGFSASYNGTNAYSRVFLITYSSTANSAIIAISPTNPSLTISGNGVESTATELTVSNNGNVAANISLSATGNQPSYLVESSNTCTSTLGASSSCVITLKLGPTSRSTESNGTAVYTVDYTASGQIPSGSVSSNVDWLVQGYVLSLSLTNQSGSGATSGTGVLAESYIFNGYNPESKLITLTYTNTGTDPMAITDIQDTNSAYTWEIGSTGTTCLAGTTVLQPNDTCNIIYTNVLSANVSELGNIGISYEENLIVPTFTYQDEVNPSLQSQAQPNLPTGGTTVYAQSHQAVLTNTITVNNPGTSNESVTIDNLLSNAAGYTDVFVTSQMDDYSVADSGSYSPTCSSSSTGGVLTQGCTLSENMVTGSGTYTVNQAKLNPTTDLILSVSYDNNAVSAGLTVSMTPLSDTANLGKTPAVPLIFVTTAAYRGGYILQDANNSSPAPNPALTSGLAAGDYLCNLEAATNTTTYPGTYKALLAGADRVPGSSDWVLQANQPYKNQRGYTIGTTDANAKLPAVLDFSIGDNDDFVWSGFDADWGVSNNNCGTWASGNAGNGTYGTASALTYFSEYSSGYLYTDEGGDPGTINCYSSGNASRLYCVQQ